MNENFIRVRLCLLVFRVFLCFRPFCVFSMHFSWFLACQDQRSQLHVKIHSRHSPLAYVSSVSTAADAANFNDDGDDDDNI